LQETDCFNYLSDLMKNELLLKSGWIKIERIELNKLRRHIRIVYENQGGSKKFNSHLPNYEELRQFIGIKLDAIKKHKNMDIKIQGQEFYELIPGNTFFRDLFYSKMSSESSQFQEYNIDICYLYAFGKTRIQQLNESRIPAFDAEISGLSDRSFSIIVSSTLGNMTEADKVKNHIIQQLQYPVESDTRNSPGLSKGTLKELYEKLDSNSMVFVLISRDYLQNENCVKQLIDFTTHNLDVYAKHTFHILLKDVYEGDFNIFDSLGRSELLKYWKLRIEQLEENHKLLLKGRKEQEFYTKLNIEFDEIKGIIEGLSRVVDLIRESTSGSLYEIFLNKVNSREEFLKLLPKPKMISPLDIKLETTYKRIKIPSTNNPKKPEFPPYPFYTPKYPASETYKIEIPGFSDVWLKDESTNPTGTHKDRLAWEVVIKYKSLIEGLKYKDSDALPQMSIISSGSAAIAIQHLFNLFNLPTKLKVLVDYNLNPNFKKAVKDIGCELYECDLSAKLLSSEDIKELTDNKNGIDITYREVLDPTHDNYYDWMSYEILQSEPEYCFIPFGTGDLFINVLNIVKIEYFNSFVSKHDPRFFSNIEKLKRCSFLGASSSEPETRLDKLFSNYLPSIDSFYKYIKELKDEYACVGKMTDIYFVKEKFVDEAIAIATRLNLTFEPSGMAGLALLLEKKDFIPNDAKILIVNTGKTKDVERLKK